MAARLNPSSLEVQAVVVHDVPLPREASEPRLTDNAVDLDEDLKRYFKDKVAESLRARGLEIQADSSDNRAVRDACQAIVLDEQELVVRSKTLGQHLYAVQSNINSPGLLAVVHGHVGGERCIALLKLERERGVRAHLTTEGGETIIDLTYLRDLTLTDKTKVFKTAVLAFGDPGSADTMYGLASDDQRGRHHGEDVARFFLHDFLGCDLRASPDKTTLAFFEATEHFINEEVSGPEKKGRYHVALLATMQDAERDLNPKAFADRSLEIGDRAKFREALRVVGLGPEQTFQKETSLVDRRMAGFRITFESGMTLVGKRSDLEEKVDLPERQQGNTVIRDTLRRLRGR